MEMGNRIEAYVRSVGVAAGIAVVAVLVLAFRVPDGTGTLGADVIMSISPTGELGVSRPGPFMSATGLRPGGSFRGATAVHNQTGSRLMVRLRALPDSKDLDRVLRVEVSAGGTRVYTGPLGGLRRSTKAFELASGERRALRLQASLPSGLKQGHAGRIETVKLELESSVESGRG
jgi:hypothetical protein